jgi:hypothetical protein
MSDTQFTKLDWRPSKKRASVPRKRDWGGQKRAPAAFLAMAPFVGFGKGPQARCCVARCNAFAMKGAPSCRKHGGAGIVARYRRPFVRSLRAIGPRPSPGGQEPGELP